MALPAGWLFGSIVGVFGLYWLYHGLAGFTALEPEKWARGMFGLSLVVLLAFSGMVAAAPLL